MKEGDEFPLSITLPILLASIAFSLLIGFALGMHQMYVLLEPQPTETQARNVCEEEMDRIKETNVWQPYEEPEDEPQWTDIETKYDWRLPVRTVEDLPTCDKHGISVYVENIEKIFVCDCWHFQEPACEWIIQTRAGTYFDIEGDDT